MNDITSTALTDAVKRKHELAAEIDALRETIRRDRETYAKMQAELEKWRTTCAELHDEREALKVSMEASRKGLESMTLWAHLRMWWDGFSWREKWWAQ